MPPPLRHVGRAAIAAAAIALAGHTPVAQTPAATASLHARQLKRLLIKNAMVIPGPATPAYGPVDVLAEDGLIARIGASSADDRWPSADMIIDASGKYVMPGIVNTHMHWHEERGGPLPVQAEPTLH